MDAAALAIGAELEEVIRKFKESVNAGVVIGTAGDVFGEGGQTDKMGGAFLEVMKLMDVAGEDGDDGEVANEAPDLGAIGESGGFGVIGEIVVVGKGEGVEAVVGEDE